MKVHFLSHLKTSPLVKGFKIFKIQALCWFLYAVVTPALIAQDADEIWTLEKVLQRHAQAHGDAALRQNLKSIRIRGHIVSPQGNYDMVLIKKRPQLARMTLFLPEGLRKVRAYDGDLVWEMVDQYDAALEPEKQVLPPDEAQIFIRDSRFLGHLLESETSGLKLEFVGRSYVNPREELLHSPSASGTESDKASLKESIECFHLRDASSDKSRIEFFLDTETFLEVKIISQKWDGETWQNYEHYLSDYRDLGPIQGAFRVDTYHNGNFHSGLRVDAVNFNIGIYSEYFSLHYD